MATRRRRAEARWSQLFAAIAAAAALAALPACAESEEERHAIPDADIERAIGWDLDLAHAIGAEAVEVDVTDGVVSLEGTVDTILAEDRAVRIAESTRGVRSVVDRLDVVASERPDGQIADDVRAALARDPATDSWEIDAQVQNGIVTLRGEVESFAERELAATVAKGVRGVRGVTNDIRIHYPEERLDSEIAKEVEQRLRWDLRVDDALIEVSVEDGEVELSGTVGSAFERSLARRDAWVNGAKSVDADGLEVRWWARDEMQRKAFWPTISDADVEKAVADALLYDPRVASFEVDVRAENGTVTLEGVVDNPKARHAAAEDARNTLGVFHVRNHLKVRSQLAVSDEVVEESVRDALARDPVVDPTAVDVEAFAGDVYLYGEVDSYFERSQAGEVASRIAGVTDVENHIVVDYAWPSLGRYGFYDWDPVLYDYDFDRETVRVRSDEEIREAIVSELTWSPFVDADEVTVTVEDGEATLTGTVDGWRERRAAVENAFEGGALRVRNRLETTHDPGA